MTRIGIALPSFSPDINQAIDVASEADRLGIDGVFAFDHLLFFESADGTRRVSHEPFVLLGAIAAKTSRVKVGTLVARSSLRYPAILAHSFDTLLRLAPDRVIAGLGSGDSKSRPEMQEAGIPFGTKQDRHQMLLESLDACKGRGYPVWIGGAASSVGRIAEKAEGWNLWGASPEEFKKQCGELGVDDKSFVYTVGIQVSRDDPNLPQVINSYSNADWCIIGVRGGAAPKDVSTIASALGRS